MTKKIDYLELLKKSFQQFKKNLILIVPMLIAIGLSIILMLIIALEIGLITFVTLNGLVPLGIIIGTIFGILDLLLILSVASYIQSMYFGGYYEITKKGKTDMKQMLSYAKKLWRKVFKINLIRAAIIIIPLLVLGAIALSLFLVSVEIGTIVSIILGIIYGIYFFAAIIILYFGLFFIGPKVITENKTAWELIKSSIAYTKENLNHVLMTFLVIFLVGLTFGIAQLILMGPLMIMQTIFATVDAIGLMMIIVMLRMIIGIALAIIRLVIQLTIQIFIFNSYFTKK